MRVLVATLFVALHGAAFAASPPQLAIYPLKAVGTSAEAMQQLEAALRIELKRAQDLEIVEGPVARECKDVTCLVNYGYSLQAQEVLTGEVRAMPDSYSVSMRLFDVASGKEIAHTAGSYNRDIEEMVWATRAQVARLKAPQRYAGQLVVEAPAGSVAPVNGSPGKLGERLVLKAGLHEVRLERAGKAAQGWVEVRFEQVATAKLAGEGGLRAHPGAEEPAGRRGGAGAAGRDGARAVRVGSGGGDGSQGGAQAERGGGAGGRAAEVAGDRGAGRGRGARRRRRVRAGGRESPQG